MGHKSYIFHKMIFSTPPQDEAPLEDWKKDMVEDMNKNTCLQNVVSASSESLLKAEAKPDEKPSEGISRYF